MQGIYLLFFVLMSSDQFNLGIINWESSEFSKFSNDPIMIVNWPPCRLETTWSSSLLLGGDVESSSEPAEKKGVKLLGHSSNLLKTTLCAEQFFRFPRYSERNSQVACSSILAVQDQSGEERLKLCNYSRAQLARECFCGKKSCIL